MITPLAIADPDAASDEEIVAAFIEEGLDEAEARVHLDVIRGRLPD